MLYVHLNCCFVIINMSSQNSYNSGVDNINSIATPASNRSASPTGYESPADSQATLELPRTAPPVQSQQTSNYSLRSHTNNNNNNNSNQDINTTNSNNRRITRNSSNNNTNNNNTNNNNRRSTRNNNNNTTINLISPDPSLRPYSPVSTPVGSFNEDTISRFVEEAFGLKNGEITAEDLDELYSEVQQQQNDNPAQTSIFEYSQPSIDETKEEPVVPQEIIPIVPKIVNKKKIRKRQTRSSKDEVEDEGEEEYEVEKILEESFEDGKWWYSLKWKGYPDPTWEPIENLGHAQDLLIEFRANQEAKKREQGASKYGKIKRKPVVDRTVNYNYKAEEVLNLLMRAHTNFTEEAIKDILDNPLMQERLKNDSPEDIAAAILQIRPEPADSKHDEPNVRVLPSRQAKNKVQPNFYNQKKPSAKLSTIHEDADTKQEEEENYVNEDEYDYIHISDEEDEQESNKRKVVVKQVGRANSEISLPSLPPLPNSNSNSNDDPDLVYNSSAFDFWDHEALPASKDVDVDKTVYRAIKAKQVPVLPNDISTVDPLYQKLKHLVEDDNKQQRIDEFAKSPLDMVAILDLEVHKKSYLSNISQICAIALNGKKVFNRYIQHFHEPYLDEAWMQLVVSGYVDIDPSEKPSQSDSFPDAILYFCNVWPAGTLFIFQGTNDYHTLVRNFRNHADDNTANIINAIEVWKTRNYRFVNASALLKLQEIFPAHLTAALHTVFRTVFNDSLIYNNSMKMFVYNYDTKELLHQLLGKSSTSPFAVIDPSFKKIGWDRDKTQAENTAQQRLIFDPVDIWYNTTGIMEPVYHYAHTDALVLRNIIITALIFIQAAPVLFKYRDLGSVDEINHTDEEGKFIKRKIWEEIVTCIFVNTGAFRKYHLGCNDPAIAAVLFEVFRNNTTINNTYYIAHDVLMENKKSPLESENSTSYRTVEYFASRVSSPEDAIALFKKEEIGRRSNAHGPKYDVTSDAAHDEIKNFNIPEAKVKALYTFKLFLTPDFPEMFTNPPIAYKGSRASRKESLQNIIYKYKKSLQGDGCPLPVEYEFNRSDIVNYAEFHAKAVGEALSGKRGLTDKKKKELIDKARNKMMQTLTNKPCLIILSAAEKQYPKTYTLHQVHCIHIELEHDMTKVRQASEQSLYVVDFEKHTTFSFRLRFCKDCKKWSQREVQVIPMYGPKAEQRRVAEQEARHDSDFKQLAEIMAQSNREIVAQLASDRAAAGSADLKQVAEMISKQNNELVVQLTKIKQENPSSQQQQPIINVSSPPVYVNLQDYPIANNTRARQQERSKTTQINKVGQSFFSADMFVNSQAKTRNRGN
jgi:hypothetical protein